ncbi:MAG TPA: metal-dependent hydrolase [Candidatus Acidoferrales bacterium]|jgi:L-ascorbate metabolism protein UlaG (beta-lactamase superfamily)|nr:metal-dependent hydrolase [Candidatus Acidoferrales bacterium]
MLNTHGNKITWLGHATFTLTTPDGKVILIDPWTIGNPACPAALKNPPRVDVMLITHGHTDHIGDAIAIATHHKPQVIAIVEIAAWLSSKGIEKVVMMNKGGTVKAGEVEATMVNAIHSSGIEDGGRMIYGGDPAGFVVKLPGGFSVYHAGDTCVFGEMKLIGELYKPDLAMLPIGDHYTMGPREAAYAIRLLGVKHVIPMHYATFPMLTGTPEALREASRDIAGLEIHAIKPGESIG